MDQPATIQEYTDYPEVLKNSLELAFDLAEIPNMHEWNLLKMLSFFDPLIAVQFYRKIIKDTYSKLPPPSRYEFLDSVDYQMQHEFVVERSMAYTPQSSRMASRYMVTYNGLH